MRDHVAPSRGRGLKQYRQRLRRFGARRPFTGARIETCPRPAGHPTLASRPFTGARIETFPEGLRPLPCPGRPFTGARIETTPLYQPSSYALVAPSRGRGLKRMRYSLQSLLFVSPLHGGAD